MIKCYNEKVYAFFAMIYGMILFLPIAIICIGGAVASGILWLINKLRGFMK